MEKDDLNIIKLKAKSFDKIVNFFETNELVKPFWEQTLHEFNECNNSGIVNMIKETVENMIHELEK